MHSTLFAHVPVESTGRYTLQNPQLLKTDVTQGSGLAEAVPGARLVLLDGAGHIPHARHPVRVNLLIRDFVRGLRGREA